jgi:hypothetical protein
MSDQYEETIVAEVPGSGGLGDFRVIKRERPKARELDADMHALPIEPEFNADGSPHVRHDAKDVTLGQTDPSEVPPAPKGRRKDSK